MGVLYIYLRELYQLIEPASLEAQTVIYTLVGKSSSFGNSDSSQYSMTLVLAGPPLLRQHRASVVTYADGVCSLDVGMTSFSQPRAHLEG